MECEDDQKVSVFWILTIVLVHVVSYFRCLAGFWSLAGLLNLLNWLQKYLILYSFMLNDYFVKLEKGRPLDSLEM